MTAATTGWQDRAACKGLAADLFFPERGEPATAAKAVCVECQVADDCLMYAITNLEISGVWGGKDGKERRRIRRQLIDAGVIAPAACDPTRPTACGTRSGYITHRRNGEDACQECKDANTEYQAIRRQQRSWVAA